jgi:hypothetical protein
MRSQDWRDTFSLVGACREVGDDWGSWRRLLLERLADLAGFELVFSVEMGQGPDGRLVDLGYVDHGFEHGFCRRTQEELYRRVDEDRSLHAPLMAYLERASHDPGAVCTRRDLLTDAQWYGTAVYHDVYRALGVDESLWSFDPWPTHQAGWPARG